MEILKMIFVQLSGHRRLGKPAVQRGDRRKNRIRICLGLCMLLMGITALGGSVYGHSWETAALEYRIKAAFLLNFTKFISWPDDRLDDKDAPIIICVVGENHFGVALDAIRGKTVRGRPIEVRYLSNPAALPSCHVAFMSHSLQGKGSEILRKLTHAPVLTVGETRDFARQGGMINFIMKNNKIRFEINPSVVKASSLKISSQLLKLAVIVETDHSRES